MLKMRHYADDENDTYLFKIQKDKQAGTVSPCPVAAKNVGTGKIKALTTPHLQVTMKKP